MMIFKLSFSCLVLLQLYILSVKGWIPATTPNLQRSNNAVFKYSVDATTATTSSFKSFLLATKNNKNDDYGADTDFDADFDSLSSSDSRRDFMTKSCAFAMTTTAASIVSASATSSFILTTKPALAATVTATEENNNKNNKIYKVPSNSLDGKIIVITGGTAGLGLESAKRLASGGATIILTSRTSEKGETAVKNVKEYLQLAAAESSSSLNNDKNNNNVYSAVLDLDDLKSVESFPERLRKTLTTIATTSTTTSSSNSNKVDVLMNNAGVMAVPNLEMTKDGYERTFQSNHLGHFVLTSKLYSNSLLSSDARIINVSSEAYQFASISTTSKQGLDVQNLNGEKEYGPWKSYGLSKLANIMFTQELQRRLDIKNSKMTVYTLHPGAVNTDLIRNFVGEDKYFAGKEKAKGPQTFVEKVIAGTVKAALKTVEEGASTQIYLAAAAASDTTTPPLLQKGEFYVGYKPEKLPDWAKDETLAKELWEKSEQLSGVSFTL